MLKAIKPMQTFNELHESINLVSQMAKDNYDARNAIIDRFNDEYEANGEPRRCQYVKGECNYYLPITDGLGNKLNEIRVDCDVIPTIKGDYRYLYKINGKKIARKNLIQQLINLSVQ
jgi:hypothetical protein